MNAGHAAATTSPSGTAHGTPAPSGRGVGEPGRFSSGWQARPRADADSLARRAATLKRLRRAIALVSILLIGSWVTVFGLKQVSGDFLAQFASLEQTPDGHAMRSPRIAGVDADGRAFSVKAQSASQRRDARDLVTLAAPVARSGIGLEDEVAARADEGVYSDKDKILDLAGDVIFTHGRNDDLLVFRSPSARVLVGEKEVSTEEGVAGAGRMGLVVADRLTANDENNRIVLEGGVRIHAGVEADAEPGSSEDGS